MRAYFDTGVLLKLYTLEPESDAARAFVVKRNEAIPATSLHLAESTSALKLKCFRGECTEEEANGAIADIEADLHSGVLISVGGDWEEIWTLCRFLSEHHTAKTGARTLDALHVACARQIGFREFVTTDKRQAACAKAAGLRVLSPIPIQ